MKLAARHLFALTSFLIVAIFGGCQTTQTKQATEKPRESRVLAAAPQTLRIATFNIENLGKAKLNKPGVVAALVAIVRKYDVVALQEIADSSLRTPDRFLAEINRNPVGDRYAIVASERTGQQPSDKSSQEQYAVLFNTRTVRVVDAGGLFPDGGVNLFRREPLAVQLQTTDNALTFTLVTIHTDPDVAPKEIAALGKAHAWVRSRFPEKDGVIILGDFNAGVASTKPSELAAIRRNDLPFFWVVPDDADTTLAVKPQAHDRIVVSGKLAQRFTNLWGVDRAFTDGDVSDHWPVWAEFAKHGNN
jgi:endonuclease/exonuclease/phosphatase family metal-dependent hydrolase